MFANFSMNVKKNNKIELKVFKFERGYGMSRNKEE